MWKSNNMVIFPTNNGYGDIIRSNIGYYTQFEFRRFPKMGDPKVLSTSNLLVSFNGQINGEKGTNGYTIPILRKTRH